MVPKPVCGGRDQREDQGELVQLPILLCDQEVVDMPQRPSVRRLREGDALSALDFNEEGVLHQTDGWVEEVLGDQ